MNGLQLAIQLKRLRKQLPIVLLSSVNNIYRKEHEHLFCATLTRPVKQHQLLRVLMHELHKENSSFIGQLSKGLFDGNLSINYPYKILVAEDFGMNQKLIRRVSNKLSYERLLVNNGTEVPEIIKSHPIDIILMDVQMPEMDGLQAIQIIRTTFSGKQRYIIATTATATVEDELECLKAGMDAYLTKPLNVKELIAAIQAVKFSDAV
jgi:CheY-like chemotaxis protein